MGVIDTKLRPDGDLCILEINPQGQFLFIEALTGLALTDVVAELLIGSTEQMERMQQFRSSDQARNILSLHAHPEGVPKLIDFSGNSRWALT